MNIEIENTFSNRLKQLIVSKKLKQKEFAEITNTGERNVSTALKGQYLPSFKFVEGILKAYEQLNARWLLTGEGDMWCDDHMRADDDKEAQLNAIGSPDPVMLNKEVKNGTTASEAAAVYASKNDKDTEIRRLLQLIEEKDKQLTDKERIISMQQKVIDMHESKIGSGGETQLQSKAS